MSEWLIVLVLAACGAGFLAFPFFRPQTDTDAQKARPTEDRPSPEPVIAAAASERPTPLPARSPSRNRVAAATLVGVVLTGAVGLYLATASGVAELSPPTAMPQSAQPKLPDVDTMIARIVERLKQNPANAEDWRMLGWSYFETKHYPEAVDAYAHAVELQPQSAAFQSAYGEALVLAADGKVTPQALKAFAVALKSAPADQRALHFRGLAKKTTGDAKGAIADWLAALKGAEPESVWSSRLRAELVETAKAASIDISAQLPPSAPLTAEQFAAIPAQAGQQAQSMSAEEQQGMIRTMVAGLDERLSRNPRDRDGWIRLIRSRKVLGEPDQARSALDRALVAFVDDPLVQTQLKTAALELGVSVTR